MNAASQSSITFTAALLTIFWCAPSMAQPIGLAADHPNVLVIIVDDLGQRDLGCYGSTFYETPHIDRLASGGTLFTDAYAACPVCSPTRCSLMTGQWPQRWGVTDYIGAPLTPEAWPRNTILRPAAYCPSLALEAPTLAKLAKQQAYATFFAGKWHLGPEGFFPEDQGFDLNLGGIERGGPYGGNRYFSPYGNPRLPDGPEGEHLPDRLASETVQFIESQSGQPFLAVLSFYSVHTPLMARKDLQQKYAAKRKRLNLQDQWGREEPRDVRQNQSHAVYAAMIEAMDQAVGKVLDCLQQLNLSHNTIVVFTSDNGGLSTSEGWPTSNRPLRAGKGWIYEGGIRVPLIIRWPGESRSLGKIVTTPVSSPDLYATLEDLLGSTDTVKPTSDGASWLPMLRGEIPAERPLFWHYPHYGNQGGAPASAVRLGKWKLIRWYEDSSFELFDLQEDIGESNNVILQHPDIAERLKSLLGQWLVEVGASFPIGNADYRADRVSGKHSARPPNDAAARGEP